MAASTNVTSFSRDTRSRYVTVAANSGADRGALVLECDDGLQFGLEVTNFALSEADRGGSFALSATGFAVTAD